MRWLATACSGRDPLGRGKVSGNGTEIHVLEVSLDEFEASARRGSTVCPHDSATRLKSRRDDSYLRLQGFRFALGDGSAPNTSLNARYKAARLSGQQYLALVDDREIAAQIRNVAHDMG